MLIYKTPLGECYNDDSLEIMKTLDTESVDLVITSPPFALQRKKEYGNEITDDYVDWILPFGEQVYRVLKVTGSFVLDLGGAYLPKRPEHSLYQFKTLIALCNKAGFQFAQPFYWYNPTALPAPIEWVNKKKLRAKTSVNTVWWLCKNASLCKSNITKVLTPYSDRMKKLFKNPEQFVAKEGMKRPSGHVVFDILPRLKPWAFCYNYCKKTWMHNNGGAIPPNMLQISNTESNSQYLKYVRALGIKGHPARFPEALPEFFIKMLTNENDMVMDIFSGSNTTGAVCERLNRRWKAIELSPEYAAASWCRFASSEEDARLKYTEILKKIQQNKNI